MSLILHAARFAYDAHMGVMRKYHANVPYYEHVMRVAGRATVLADATEEIVAAAWLHDVLEDCPLFAERLPHEFGEPVLYFVKALTNPSKQHSELPRSMRKSMDRAHFVGACRAVRIIKFFDRIDNVRDLGGATEKFKKLYREESTLLSEVLVGDGTDDFLVKLHNELKWELSNL